MRTHTWMLVTVSIALLVLLGTGGVWLYMSLHKQSTVPSQTSLVPNPFGSTGGSQTQALGSMSIVLTNGEAATIPDITKFTQPAWAGPETGYVVAGSDTGDYLATYIPSDGKAPSEFLVTLYAEPIGATRKAAEAALRNRLGLTNTELCALSSIVATAPGVNTSFDGINLGFSFCAGAVKLP